MSSEKQQDTRLCLRLSPLLVIALLFVTTQSAFAFMTFWWFGGAVHEAIIDEALRPLGVKSSALRMIVRGANSADNPLCGHFAVPEHHACSNEIKGTFDYFIDCTERATIIAADAYKVPRHRERSLYVLGEGMHALADFYSHSNYLEWLLKNDLPLVPIDWQNIPPDVRTCYYQYNCFTDQEVLHSRRTSIRKLEAKYANAKFRSQEDYIRLKHDRDYEAVLQYALAPGDLMHLELNKDNGSMPEGKVIAPRYGKTFHALACQLAALDTARQWQKFEALVRERFKARSALIIPALKGMTLPDITVTISPGDNRPAGDHEVAGEPVRGRLRLAVKNTAEPMEVGIHACVVETGQKIDYVVKKEELNTSDHSLEILLEKELPLKTPAKKHFRVNIETYFTADPQFKRGHATAVF